MITDDPAVLELTRHVVKRSHFRVLSERCICVCRRLLVVQRGRIIVAVSREMQPAMPGSLPAKGRFGRFLAQEHVDRRLA